MPPAKQKKKPGKRPISRPKSGGAQWALASDADEHARHRLSTTHQRLQNTMLSQELTKKLGEVVVRPQLDGLTAVIPVDRGAEVSNEPRGDLVRWFWNGLLYTDDQLSVRVSLRCQADGLVRTKVRGYYDKAFASIGNAAPGKRNRQEVYTGKTRKFMVDAANDVAFSDWLENELRDCTTALRHYT
jgi:hypothetical protein